MATAANPAAGNYPLQDELGLINYFKGVLGLGDEASGNGAKREVSANLTPITGNEIPQVTDADLMKLMTEFLRTDGKFLNTMFQQNQAGLYNSTTRKLLGNDLLAQAALKAATDKSRTSALQAQLASQIASSNKDLSLRAAISNATVAKQPGIGQKLLEALAAGGINAYNTAKKNAKKGEEPQMSKKPDRLPTDRGATTEPVDTSGNFNGPYTPESIGPQLPAGFESMFEPSQLDSLMKLIQPAGPAVEPFSPDFSVVDPNSTLSFLLTQSPESMQGFQSMDRAMFGEPNAPAFRADAGGTTFGTVDYGNTTVPTLPLVQDPGSLEYFSPEVGSYTTPTGPDYSFLYQNPAEVGPQPSSGAGSTYDDENAWDFWY